MDRADNKSSRKRIDGMQTRVRPKLATTELKRQLEYFDAVAPDRAIYNGVPHRFAERSGNLAHFIAETAGRYFQRDGLAGITWHTHSNHMLSSQACCINFLLPLADNPDRLAALVGQALGIDPPEMLEVESGPDGNPWFIGFEWIGKADYLNEAGRSGRLRRGANCTSADAFVRFRTRGRTEGLLIEWKYTESYGSPLPDRTRQAEDGSGATGGHATRRARYSHLMRAPDGPLKPDVKLSIDDFFYEPFYQLLRQQMLAHRMEKAGEADVVRVLHISPRSNRKLHDVTSPAIRAMGETDAFEAFKKLLAQPDRFVSRTTEEIFMALIDAAPAGDPWASYLRDRYSFIQSGKAV